MKVVLICERKNVQNLITKKYAIMKKSFLAVAIAVMLSAGLTSKTQAQTKAVSIENLSTENAVKKSVVITETPVYNKAGKLLYTVKRYDESALSKDVSRIIRNQFYDFDIIGVEEVVIPDNSSSIYLVHIANDTKLKTIRVYDGESEVINEYKKG